MDITYGPRHYTSSVTAYELAGRGSVLASAARVLQKRIRIAAEMQLNPLQSKWDPRDFEFVSSDENDVINYASWVKTIECRGKMREEDAIRHSSHDAQDGESPVALHANASNARGMCSSFTQNGIVSRRRFLCFTQRGGGIDTFSYNANYSFQYQYRSGINLEQNLRQYLEGSYNPSGCECSTGESDSSRVKSVRSLCISEWISMQHRRIRFGSSRVRLGPLEDLEELYLEDNCNLSECRCSIGGSDSGQAGSARSMHAGLDPTWFGTLVIYNHLRSFVCLALLAMTYRSELPAISSKQPG
ncbi:hypothetical protein EAI_08968 [Harpegnathos saltator]|uniref:Uncharacterized protein n=1 Tax=Harpegnathos saltator TaxID=610380 RepID=E2C2X7_HARSA|nr:hypothetical protein EAI_08968 [Harpegnathos saltator]